MCICVIREDGLRRSIPYKYLWIITRQFFSLWAKKEKKRDLTDFKKYIKNNQKPLSGMQHSWDCSQIAFQYLRNQTFLYRSRSCLTPWMEGWSPLLKRTVIFSKYDDWIYFILRVRNIYWTALSCSFTVTEPDKNKVR